MATLENVRNELIDNILTIKNRDILEALDKLISISSLDSDIVLLTDEQKILLEMSEKDIEAGDLISQEAIDKRILHWLETT